jgi:outer membrane protein assembly factor BamB
MRSVSRTFSILEEFMKTMLCLLACAGLATADDWPAFRGPTGLGTSTETKVPTAWSATKNVKWKAALPQTGNGSPIVSNGRVFVAGVEDGARNKRALWCFDRKDGKLLWTRVAEFAKNDPTHNTNEGGGATPAADGKRVVVWQSSAGLVCYDFEGKELWKRELGEFRHMWGFGNAPVLHGGKVFLNSGPGAKVFTTALDLESGKTVWTTEEPQEGDGQNNAAKKPMGSWATPLVVKSGALEVVVVVMPTRVVAYNPADGKIVWWCMGVRHGKGDLAYSSPALAGDLLVVYGGYNGPGMAIRLGGRGDVTASHRVWRNEGNPQSIGSGVVIDGALYIPHDDNKGIYCVDPRSGKVLWQDPADRSYWGSAVTAAGRIYVTARNGSTAVFKASPQKFELLSRNELGEGSNSTPAISDGEIFIRTYRTLWCIGE